MCPKLQRPQNPVFMEHLHKVVLRVHFGGDNAKIRNTDRQKGNYIYTNHCGIRLKLAIIEIQLTCYRNPKWAEITSNSSVQGKCQ